MEQYEYAVLAKEDFMVYPKTDMVHVDDPGTGKEKFVGGVTPPSFFDTAKFENSLIRCGQDGFRVITKLYNAPDDWVLVLSRPLAYLPKSNRRA